MCVRCCATWDFRAKRPALYQIISMQRVAKSGSTTRGPAFYARPRDAKHRSCLKMGAALPGGGGGQQPTVKRSGKRKGYKVFGAIEYFSGRLFYQGLEDRFTSNSYQAFIQMILAHTTEHLFLIHDGARYHTSQAT